MPSLIAPRRTYGQGITDLIEAMWNGDPRERPSMSQCVIELGVLIATEKDKDKEKRGGRH